MLKPFLNHVTIYYIVKILPIWIIKHIRMSYNVKILPKRIVKHVRMNYNVKILLKRIPKPPKNTVPQIKFSETYTCRNTPTIKYKIKHTLSSKKLSSSSQSPLKSLSVSMIPSSL